MNLQRARFGHRRASPQKQDFGDPLTNRTNVDFRNSALNDYKFNIDRDSFSTSPNRHSFDIQTKPITMKRKEREAVKNKMTSINNIRNTLTQLKQRIETAKSSLKSNQILNKNIIFEEPEDQQIKTIQLISFNESSGSQRINNSSLDQSKKEFLQQLRKYQPADLSRMKGYYLSQVAKALKEGGKDILNHIAFNWKVLRSCGSLPQPKIEQILEKKSKIQFQNSGRRVLVLGLDNTIAHIDWYKQSDDDIDVKLKVENNKERQAYISLRPYAMTFLKKMSKKYDVVIFSDRSRQQTNAILDVLDPFHEKCKLRLSLEDCIKVKNVWTKDLRVLGRELSQVLIVDHEPYSYLFQTDNAVPIIPFHRGNDDQLYGLEKYLQEVLRSSDVRKVNRDVFQLHRYNELGSSLEVVQNLYLNRKKVDYF